MVILSIHYLNAYGDSRIYDSEPMEVNAAMARVMRFVQAGCDVIQRNDTGSIDVLLMHRVTGITIVPAVSE